MTERSSSDVRLPDVTKDVVDRVRAMCDGDEAGCLFLVPETPNRTALSVLTGAAGMITGFGRLTRPLPDEQPRLYLIARKQLGAAGVSIFEEDLRYLALLVRNDPRFRQLGWPRNQFLFSEVATFANGQGDSNHGIIRRTEEDVDMEDHSAELGGASLQFPKEELEYLASALRRDAASPESAVAATIGSDAMHLGDFVATVKNESRRTAETLSLIALRMAQADFIKQDLARLVLQARRDGVTWSDVGRAAGVTPQAALRRWSPVARQKHSDYQRNRAQQRDGQ